MYTEWGIFQANIFLVLIGLITIGEFWTMEGKKLALLLWKSVHHRQYQKIHQMFMHLFKFNFILLANTLTPSNYTDWPIHWHLAITPTLVLTKKNYLKQPLVHQLPPCNNIQICKYRPANAKATKSVNCLYLQTGQLLEVC